MNPRVDEPKVTFHGRFQRRLPSSDAAHPPCDSGPPSHAIVWETHFVNAGSWTTETFAKAVQTLRHEATG